jgi:hypothetical protein
MTLIALCGFFLVLSGVNGFATDWTGGAIGPLFLVSIAFGFLYLAMRPRRKNEDEWI